MHNLSKIVLVAGLFAGGATAALAAPAHHFIRQDQNAFRATYQAPALAFDTEQSRTTGFVGVGAGERAAFDRTSALTGG